MAVEPFKCSCGSREFTVSPTYAMVQAVAGRDAHVDEEVSQVIRCSICARRVVFHHGRAIMVPSR